MLAAYPIGPTLPAADVDRARAFYRDVLGFAPVEVIPETGETVFESAGLPFVVYPSIAAGTNRATCAAWRVPDLEAAMADLRRRGVEFEEYDLPGLTTEGGIAVMPDGTRTAWFRDSEGNILALDQLPPGRPLAVS